MSNKLVRKSLEMLKYRALKSEYILISRYKIRHNNTSTLSGVDCREKAEDEYACGDCPKGLVGDGVDCDPPGLDNGTIIKIVYLHS